MAEIDRLVAHADERYRPAIWLLVLAGLRTSELCGLRVMDLNWERGSLTVNEVQMWVKGELVVKGPKTASGVRTIPVPAWLLDDITAVLDQRAKRTGVAILETDRLFTSPTGKHLLDHTLWRIINRARLAAELPWFRPYDLRHSHASLLINLGAHPKAISERMGHTEIGVTMNVYGHRLAGLRPPAIEVATQQLTLDAAPPHSDPDDQPTTAVVVDRGQLLGEQDRIVLGRQEDAAPNLMRLVTADARASMTVVSWK